MENYHLTPLYTKNICSIMKPNERSESKGAFLLSRTILHVDLNSFYFWGGILLGNMGLVFTWPSSLLLRQKNNKVTSMAEQLHVMANEK